MIRSLFCMLLLAFAVFGCGESVPGSKPETPPADTTSNTVSPPAEEETPVQKPEYTTADLIGYYVGEFKATKYDESKNYVYYNKINISIDSIIGDSLMGHSVVAGNDRPFQGSIRKQGEVYQGEGREPGDDRYDGVFRFTVDPSLSKMTGQWVAYNNKLPVSERGYELEKRSFRYDPNLRLSMDVGWAELYERNPKIMDQGEFVTEDVLKFNPSTELLKKEDVENLYKGDIEVIRNSIYARHGYSFKNRKMRFVFDKYVEWYIPVSTDIRDQLTDVERKNIALLKRYEEHAERYYDVFGR
ncbi:MAG: YARHG domain-containing protein [Bacteroidota bacterium]